MVKYFLAVFFMFSIFSVNAQDDVYDNEDEDEDDVSEVSTSSGSDDWKDRFFLGLTSSVFIDFISSPLGTYKVKYTNPDNSIRYEDAAYQTSYSSYFTIGIEPRYNLIDLKDNLSLALSAPATIGFGQSGPASEQVAGAYGFGNFQIPVLLRLYFGTGSTYKESDNFGIDIGAGVELNKIGIFNFEQIDVDEKSNRAWVMPAVTAGIHFYRGMTPVEINIKYGFGPLTEQRVDKFGNSLGINRRITRATSLKLSMVYPLN